MPNLGCTVEIIGEATNSSHLLRAPSPNTAVLPYWAAMWGSLYFSELLICLYHADQVGLTKEFMNFRDCAHVALAVCARACFSAQQHSP